MFLIELIAQKYSEKVNLWDADVKDSYEPLYNAITDDKKFVNWN